MSLQLAGPANDCRGIRRHGRTGYRPAVLVLLIFAVVFLAALGRPAPAVAYTTQELAFLDLINQYRQQNGLERLLLSDTITEACWRHNSDMGKYGFFDHNTVQSDFFAAGSTPWARMAACGYSYNTYKGENIAAGYTTAQAAFDAWKSSPGHNANMLGSNFRVIGISMLTVPGSRYATYWTTDFGGYVDPTAHDAGGLPPVAPADGQPPSVSFTSPKAGANVSGNLVVIEVSATDNIGVSRVEVGINGSATTTDSTPPYQFAWDTTRYPNGTCTMTATAYDAAGNSASSSIVVSVANQVSTTTTQPATTTTTERVTTTTLRPTTTTTATGPTTSITRPTTSTTRPTTTTTQPATTTTTTLPAAPTFVDVPRSHPYFAAVEGMKSANVIQGYPVGENWEFRLDAAVNRAQFAKMICGALQIEVSEDLACPFTDMGTDDPVSLYPHEYVAAAAKAGITQGVGGSAFAPWREISRAQVVTMLMRAAAAHRPEAIRVPPASFVGTLSPSGVPLHDENLRAAEYNGLLSGLSGFSPEWDVWASATRGEVAEILWALLNAPSQVGSEANQR